MPKDIAERDAETARTDDVEVEGQDAEDEEQVEVADVRARRSPKEPTEAERLRHEATHVPYRWWCQHCVHGRGRRKPQCRRSEVEEGNTVHNISMGYFFLEGEECEAAVIPMFLMLDEERGHRYARMLEHKVWMKGGMNGSSSMPLTRLGHGGTWKDVSSY